MKAKITETEWAYVAGIIDSDGCIQAPNGYGKNSHYRGEIHIIQRDMPLIDFLFSKFDGSVNVVKRNHKSGIKYYLRWMITGPRMAEILKGALPYLVLKKKQAELAIELQSIILPRGNAKKLPKEIIERRAQIALGIKSLNSPATTECVGSNLEMRQSELIRMKNYERISRSGDSASS
jgi:hypothetical protein